MIELNEMKAGLGVRGLLAAGDVTVVAVEPNWDAIVERRKPGDESTRRYKSDAYTTHVRPGVTTPER